MGGAGVGDGVGVLGFSVHVGDFAIRCPPRKREIILADVRAQAARIYFYNNAIRGIH